MTNLSSFKTPYSRPWMKEYGAAAATGSGTGIKGIVAGNMPIQKYYSYRPKG